MIVSRTHDLIHQVALVCQKQKPFGFLVKAPNGIDPHRIIQILGDSSLLALLLRAAHHATGLVKKKKNFFLHLFHRPAVHIYYGICIDLLSRLCHMTFHRHTPILDQTVCLTS